MEGSSNVRSALATLEKIGLAQGSNAKRDLLGEQRDNPVMRDICFIAYGGDSLGAYPSEQFDDSAPTSIFPSNSKLETRWERMRALVIKLKKRELTGHAAIGALDGLLSECEYVEKKWYRRMLEHDLKCGMGRGHVSDYWDLKLESLEGERLTNGIAFPGVMLCEAEEKHVKKWPKTALFLIEPKLDGLRLEFVWDGVDWCFFSRAGKSDGYNQNLSHVADDLISAMRGIGYKRGIVDGEIMSDTWGDTIAVKRKDPTPEQRQEILDKMKFHVFDHLESADDQRLQLDRRASLEDIMSHIKNSKTSVKLVRQERVDSLEAARPIYHSFVREGYEGAIVKSSLAKYVPNNKRSKEWLKLKPVDTQDVKIKGWYEGEARSRLEGNLGGFIVVDNGGQEFKVGGGFSDAQRTEFWSKGEAFWVGKWIEIAYQKDPSQVAVGRFPRLVRVREDLT